MSAQDVSPLLIFSRQVNVADVLEGDHIYSRNWRRLHGIVVRGDDGDLYVLTARSAERYTLSAFAARGTLCRAGYGVGAVSAALQVRGVAQKCLRAPGAITARRALASHPTAVKRRASNLTWCLSCMVSVEDGSVVTTAGGKRALVYSWDDALVAYETNQPAQPLWAFIEGKQLHISVDATDEMIASQHRELRFHDSNGLYEVGALIGRGSEGAVHEVTRRSDGAKLAMKVSAVPRSHALRVGDIVLKLQTLEHPNIVRVHDWNVAAVAGRDCVEVALVMELCTRTLAKQLSLLTEQRAAVPVADLRRYARGVLCGLQYLHSRDIVHRDVKLENVMLAQDGAIRLLDFGLSRDVSDVPPHVVMSDVGTYGYKAPELLSRQRYSFPVDVWSFGVVMMKLIGATFVLSYTEGEVWDGSYYGELTFSESVRCERLRDFVSSCCHHDATMRATVQQLLDHPWFLDFTSEG